MSVKHLQLATALELHPWQRDVARDTLLALSDHRRVVVSCPTGSGKTVIALLGVLPSLPKPVLWVTHRHFLRQQVEDYGVHAVDVVSVFKNIPRGGYKTVIIDEVHHAPADSYAQVFERYPEAAVVGLTATPYRLDGVGLGSCGFEKIIVSPGIRQLITSGYLSPVRDLYSNLGDCSAWSADSVVRLVASHVRKLDFRKGVIYCRTLADCDNTCVGLNAQGVNSAVISFRNSKSEVTEVLERFSDGDLRVVLNHTMLTEGYDLPHLDYVVMNRRTKSRVLWKQIYGRAMRVRPGKLAHVIDLSNNVAHHGRIFDEEHYDLAGRLVATDSHANPTVFAGGRFGDGVYLRVEDTDGSLCDYETIIDRRKGRKLHPSGVKRERGNNDEPARAPITEAIIARASEFRGAKEMARALNLSLQALHYYMSKNPDRRPTHWYKKRKVADVAGTAKQYPNIFDFAAGVGYSAVAVMGYFDRNPEEIPPHWK